MIRGGHINYAVLGALEVAANGDMANWRTPGEKVPGVGGAMDLAFGAENVLVTMTHITNKGKPKILDKCTLPLTAPRCVKRIYTDMAVVDVTPEGLVLREFAPGLDPEGGAGEDGRAIARRGRLQGNELFPRSSTSRSRRA